MPRPLSPSPPEVSGGARHAPEAPVTRREGVVDDYHGTRVIDPYRWLEDGDAPEVIAWTDAQNARTRAVLDAYAGRDALRRRLHELLDVGTVSAPAMRLRGDGEALYFHHRRAPGQQQRVYCVRVGVDGIDRALIDVATMSAEATTAIDWTSPSPDGALVAWGSSDGGSEESVLRVRDVATGGDLPEAIRRTRLVSIAWLPDGTGFFYTRYPEPGTVPAGDEVYGRKVHFHALGDAPDGSRDALVCPPPDWPWQKTFSPRVLLSPNGRYLVVRVHRGPGRADVWTRDRHAGASAPWKPVAHGIDARFDPIARDERLFLLTNWGAPRSRLMAVDYAALEPASWRAIVPEQADVLRSATVTKSTVVAKYVRDAATRLRCFSLDGVPRGELPLPAIGSASAYGSSDGDEAFVHFTSFTVPPSVLRFDLRTGASSTWARAGVGVALPAARVTLARATSRDGTPVPMYVVERAGASRDGDAPVVLTGYGGFNQVMSPSFSESAAALVEQGGVWAAALLRGGGEYGDAWHRAGVLDRKENSFDDLVACAEELVRTGITSPERLAILGSSNGGLVTAAAVTRRPDLFRAVVADVPLTDMLRYHHFRIAKLWIPEYGSSDDPEQLRALLRYSPYHRVEDGVRYPTVLFNTAVSDSRVDPLHARKMAARMQAASDGEVERPVLLRVESAAGHGAGKPTHKLLDELTDILTFVLRALDVHVDVSTRGDAPSTGSREP